MDDNFSSTYRIDEANEDPVYCALPYWCAWPNATNPQYLVRTNRDVVPEIPPENIADPPRCVDGHFGLLEASRRPQMHDPAKWHMAFVPLATPGPTEVPFELGRPWWYLEHTDAYGDLGWFRLEGKHLLVVAPGLHKPVWTLRARIETTEFETSQAWAACVSKHRVWMHRQDALVGVHARFVELSTALRQLPLTRWESIAHFADWQRCLSELRGWMSMMDATGDDPNRAAFELGVFPADLAARCARTAVETRHVGPYRGVFTRDPNVALVCAAYDVPVWLLLPFRPDGFQQLSEAGLRRAKYRKYGTAYCSYVHAIERSHYDQPQPIADISCFSRSTVAYSDLLWNASGAAKPLDACFVVDGPRHHGPPPAPGVSSPAVSVRQAEGNHLSPAETSSQNQRPPATSVRSTASSGPAPQQGCKRKSDGDDENAEPGKARKKRARGPIQRLLTAAGSSASPSDLIVTGPTVSPFNTPERPPWFPSPFSPAESILSRVDVKRVRQVSLGAAAELPIPARITSQGCLYKVPLQSYFLNAWAASRKEGFDKPKGKGGVVDESLARPQAAKPPGQNVSLSFYTWLRIRPFYLRRLASSTADAIPSLSSPEWRRTLRLMIPEARVSAIIALLGLEASQPQAEPRRLLAPEPEPDSPENENGGTDGAVEPTSTSSAPALPPLLALHVSLRAAMPERASSTSGVPPNDPHPASALEQVPVRLPSTGPPDRIADFGDYVDRIGHPTFDGHELPPWIRDEDTIWPSLPWRRYILWELGELEFRYELFSLDLAIRQSHPEYTTLLNTAGDRYRQCKACWGGSDFVPGADPRANNQLTDPDPRERLVALRQFYEFMRPWPRTDELLKPWELIVAGGDDLQSINCESNAFYDLESSIWHCYGQTYFDYRHRLPIIPHNRPDMPVG
ncbi:hypothetical protein AURDEDRAFT_163939 [Auricularia subglabra TFB-10046 SS5]|nr:hypothetical protein AURDEDRAFT_163939 [Auricularia subglabra TFB-10046 SS5]